MARMRAISPASPASPAEPTSCRLAQPANTAAMRNELTLAYMRFNSIRPAGISYSKIQMGIFYSHPELIAARAENRPENGGFYEWLLRRSRSRGCG